MTGAPAATPLIAGAGRLSALYAGLLRSELQAASAYRAQFVLGLLSWVVPLAFLALWRGAASTGTVEGISGAQFSTYFCLLLLTTNLQLLFPIIFGFGDLVYSGQLSPLLLRPHHPLHPVIARGMAERAYQLPPLLILIPLALWLTGGQVRAGGAQWLLALTLTLLGTVGVTYLSAMSAAIAFWMTKAQGVQGLLAGAQWILGGIVAPIGLLPGGVGDVLRHQPMWFADGAGPEILAGIGRHSWWLVAEAAAWVAGLHLAYRALWRRAVRRYEAVGT